MQKQITKENWDKELKMTSEWWHIIYMSRTQTMIYDPDGWDKENYTKSWYQEEITYEEFSRRAMLSTIMSISQHQIALMFSNLYKDNAETN